MVDGLIGKKIGMTQIFQEDGTVSPVTVIEAGPCVVVQTKTVERDGYESVQVGLVDPKSAKRARKPMKGHHEKAGVPPTRILREFVKNEGEEVKPGDTISVEIFNEVDRVDVSGVTKGKGFQGVIKRHGFGGGKATHGSMHHRGPGSIGQSASPSKVMRGMRGPGHMGSTRVTSKNMKIIKRDPEKNLLILQGSVPGARGTILIIRRSKGGVAAAASGGKADG